MTEQMVLTSEWRFWPGLVEAPFLDSATDPFIFRHGPFEAILQRLRLYVALSSDPNLIIGLPGSGKTTLFDACVSLFLQDSDVVLSPIRVPKSELSVFGFLQEVNRKFGIKVGWRSHLANLNACQGFVADQNGRGNTCVVLVDDADRLAKDCLDTLRALATADYSKRVKTVLFGGPALVARLCDPKERLGDITCQMVNPLSCSDVQGLIVHRLRVAGMTPQQAESVFDDESLETIFVYSGGIPRQVLCLCNKAMSYALERNAAAVCKEDVDRAYMFGKKKVL